MPELEASKNTRVRVGIIGHESRKDFYNYDLFSFEPERYFSRDKLSLRRLALGGVSELKSVGMLYSADGLDRMYRSRHPDYMRMITDFIELYRDFDLLILSRFNPIHPEILHNELNYPTKILGFIDDPGASYTRGIPYLWAFNGAFYISPSYDETHYFNDVMQSWGCAHHHWWPHGARHIEQEENDEFYRNRNFDLVYVGGCYGDKTNKLRELKEHFGDRFLIHGRWPLRGYYGFVRGFLGRPFFLHRVQALTDKERNSLYRNCKIGFNMHLSNSPRETGNMRMYEVPAHGMLQVCDKAGCGAHDMIFKDGEEAVFYDDIKDAIDKIEFYLNNEEERIRIARAGHRRVKKQYWWEDRLKSALDWAMSVRKSDQPSCV